MVLDPTDKARALGAAQATAMDKATQESESDVEPVAASDADAAPVAASDAAWASMPTREIPGFKPNSTAFKPPSKS